MYFCVNTSLVNVEISSVDFPVKIVMNCDEIVYDIFNYSSDNHSVLLFRFVLAMTITCYAIRNSIFYFCGES